MSFVFWTDEPLPAPQVSLLTALQSAHYESVFRDNISTQVVQIAALGSHDYSKAIVAGLSSIGGPHAPLAETYELLAAPDPAALVRQLLERGARVPGWGNGFVKGSPDPLWTEVAEVISVYFPAMASTIRTVTATLHSEGRALFPNPSCYTAAAALIVGLPALLAPYLFIAGRLPGWSKLVQLNLIK